MKKILLSTVALMGLTVAAGAADLPRRSIAPAPIVAVPVFTWTGFYVGVNAGYGFSDSNNDESTFFLPGGSVLNSPTTAGTLTILDNGSNGDRDGFVGGGQIGYNLQFGSFVVGLEADLQYADLQGDRRNDLFGGTYSFVGTPGLAFAPPAATVVPGGDVSGIEWFGTVRARLGVAFDRVLVYGTGGFAYGGGDNENNRFGAFSNDSDDTRIGYAVGGGIEYAFTNNLTFKLEGLYVNLEDDSNRSGFSTFEPATNTLFLEGNGKRETDFGLVRVGVNFKF
jgi:outer membrane immunogenic protein